MNMQSADGLPKYKLAAYYWTLIDHRMRSLEGEDWAAGERPEFVYGDGGPDDGHLYWRVGDRHLTVDRDHVIETSLNDGETANRRVIGPEGALADEVADSA
jgi:hypothetical protein